MPRRWSCVTPSPPSWARRRPTSSTLAALGAKLLDADSSARERALTTAADADVLVVASPT
jgi:hypothetical protein